MKLPANPPHPRFDSILKRYSQGRISASRAADEIQELNIPGYNDPSASEVILWSKMVGYGIPTPSKEEAEEEARKILNRKPPGATD